MYENEEGLTENEVVEELRALLKGEALEDTLLAVAQKPTAMAAI